MTAPSTDAPRIDLDHVGFVVEDLDATRRFLAQLGFTLTARADHTRTDASGALVSAGSSQHSIMLHNGYLELMQITDPSAGHQLALAPSARFGLHVLAFGTNDAERCHAQCLAHGAQVGPLLHWARPVAEEGAHGLAKFAYFGAADWQPADPSYLCWVQHVTPELLRPPQLLQHANGALGLAELHYRGPRLLSQAWVQRLQRAGAAREVDAPGMIALRLPNAVLRIFVDEQEPVVRPSAVVLRFSDCRWLRARCNQLGLPHAELEGGALEIDLRAALGLRWICWPVASTGDRGAM